MAFPAGKQAPPFGAKSTDKLTPGDTTDTGKKKKKKKHGKIDPKRLAMIQQYMKKTP